MKVRILSALVGPAINHQPGDIVETDEATRWIKFGIAEAVIDATDLADAISGTGNAAKDAAVALATIETADISMSKEVSARLRAKVPRTPKVAK